MSGKHYRAQARINEREAKWLDAFADRRNLKPSEAVRELIRMAYVNDFQDAAVRIAALEKEVESLKHRVGSLEAARRREHAARRKWMRVADKRGFKEYVLAKDAEVAKAQAAATKFRLLLEEELAS